MAPNARYGVHSIFGMAPDRAESAAAVVAAADKLDAGDIPASVVIDEAVTLAKQYSTREAGRLVNGILDRIYREAA